MERIQEERNFFKWFASDFKDFNSPEKKILYLNSVLDIK